MNHGSGGFQLQVIPTKNNYAGDASNIANMKRLIHVAFIAYIIIDNFYLRESLFEYTLPITKHLQKNYGFPSFIKFNRFMAYLLKPDICALFNIFYICLTSNKYQAMKSTMFQCFSLYALLFYKILMNDPRPYFVDPEIKGWECYADFGNPSGHATSIWMFYGIMLTDIWRDIIPKYKDDTIKKFIINASFLSLFAFLCVGIVFCRIFLGVHSLNQVMMGTVFGIYIYLINLWYADDLIEKLFNYLRNNKINIVFKLMSFSIAYFLMIQTPVEVYKIIETEVPEVWRQNILNSCQFEEHNMFYKVCFKACATIGIAFGPLFALVINKKANHIVLFEFNNKQVQSDYKVFSIKSILKALLGTAIFILVFAFFYKIYPISKVIKTIPIIYDKYLSMTLGSFFSTFILTLVLPKLYGSDIRQRRKSSSQKSVEVVKNTPEQQPLLGDKKSD
ncbi:hypothetical protein ABPG72_019892 [Tetrahymena utriculariae]